MKTITQPLKCHGGKFYLARRIIELMPPHIHYVEPFFGGGAVLLRRDPGDERLWLPPNKGVSEVANDIDGRLMNFWRVLQDADRFDIFRRLIEAIPLSRTQWESANKRYRDGLSDGSHMIFATTDAVAFFIDARQSRSGLMKDFTPLTRSRTRRGMNGNVSEWLGAVDGLADVHARLRRVVVESLPAVELIRREDTPGTLFYCDPPYLHSTRVATKAYAHEMTREQHVELLATLRNCVGKVMISGYRSPLYDDVLAAWRRADFEIANHASGAKSKGREIECLWMNY